MLMTLCQLFVPFLLELVLVLFLEVLVIGTHKFCFSLNWFDLGFFCHLPRMEPNQCNWVLIPVQPLFTWWLWTSNLFYLSVAFITWKKSYTKIIYLISFLCVWRLTKVVIVKCLTTVNAQSILAISTIQKQSLPQLEYAGQGNISKEL